MKSESMSFPSLNLHNKPKALYWIEAYIWHSTLTWFKINLICTDNNYLLEKTTKVGQEKIKHRSPTWWVCQDKLQKTMIHDFLDFSLETAIQLYLEGNLTRVKWNEKKHDSGHMKITCWWRHLCSKPRSSWKRPPSMMHGISACWLQLAWLDESWKENEPSLLASLSARIRLKMAFVAERRTASSRLNMALRTTKIV